MKNESMKDRASMMALRELMNELISSGLLGEFESKAKEDMAEAKQEPVVEDEGDVCPDCGESPCVCETETTEAPKKPKVRISITELAAMSPKRQTAGRRA